MSEENMSMNLIQRLAKIREISGVAAKDKRGFNYSYADITTILANVTAGMKKYHVSLVPRVVPGTMTVIPNTLVKTKVTKSGDIYDDKKTEMLVTAEMIFMWVNDDDPSDFIEVPWYLTGSQEDPSQSFGSAITYCTRYFLTSFFQIAQPDNDVDSYRSKQRAAEAAEDGAIARQIITAFDANIRGYLATHDDKTAEVKKFLSRYVKDGNYLAITEPVLASKLVSDFNENYLNKGE